MLKRLNLFVTILKDVFLNVFLSKKYNLFYVVENANWSTDWDGKYITDSLNKQKLLKGKLVTTHIGLRNKIIHFGSVNTYINNNGIKKVHPSNEIILTWFHIAPNDPRIKYIPKLATAVNKIHTSCALTQENLLQYGAPGEKIIVIPLGVDLNIFNPVPLSTKRAIKKRLGLPSNKLIIGSFQKDGDGWEQGLVPKMVKGPDIFCAIIKRLSKKYPLHILLTGPARGYVKQQLDNNNISYTHAFLDNYLDIADYYKALDLYLITSREEGGPKALLESIACEIPIISTPVGMAPDVLKETLAPLLSTDTHNDFYKKTTTLLDDRTLRDAILATYPEIVVHFNWDNIALKYYEKLYKQ